METSRKSPDCPYCGHAMTPVVMRCEQCDIEVRGEFQQTRFSQLSGEDLEFLEQYLLAGFNIKSLAEESGLGYVAIRNRLDRVIKSYQKLLGFEEMKRSILERLEKGQITAEQAAELLERL
jgi:hypothetical protein